MISSILILLFDLLYLLDIFGYFGTSCNKFTGPFLIVQHRFYGIYLTFFGTSAQGLVKVPEQGLVKVPDIFWYFGTNYSFF